MDNNLKWIFNNNTVNAAYFSNEQIYPTNENVTVNVIGPQEDFEVYIYGISKYGNNNEYTEVEYLESTGTQYIDTGFKPNNNTRVVMQAKAKPSGSNWFLFGARTHIEENDTAKTFGFNVYKTFYRTHYYNGWDDYSTSISFDDKFTIDKNKNVTTLTGNNTITSVTATFQCDYNMYLFASNTANNANTFGSIRVYSCQIYDNDVLIRDFVPVISVNNIYGLFDKINNKFYPSATDNFIGGDIVLSKLQTKEAPKYTRLEYIESTGNQYIDTGFKPNQDTRVITDFQMVEDVVSRFVYGARNTSYYEAFGFLISSATKNFRAVCENSKSMDFNVDLLRRYIIDQNKNTTTLGGVTKSTTISNFQSKYNLFLFSSNEADTVNYKSKCRIYSCKIYDNNTLIRDYIPVKNDKGVAGLYDKVNSAFYTSTEAFIEGPEIEVVQFQPTAIYKIKRNTSYMIKASDVEGYITPEKQVFTAKNYSRTVDVIYEEIPATDLSMFDIYGNPILQNTANCYVVNKTGSYKIPLVFGNALKNGSANSAAYTKNSSSYSHNFVDFNGTVVTSPYIETVSGTAASAQLSIADTDGIFTNISIVDGSPCRYLQFKVNSVPATGANGVLSIKNSSGVIMWSWHIWVWADDLSPVEIINSTGVGYNILPVNLASKWDNATKTKIKNWFYQFGRPNPMLCPSAYNSTSNHASYGALSYTNLSIASDIQTGIQNPATFYKYSSSYDFNWFQTNSGKNYNLWDAACTSTGNSDNNVVKTIYDPSPIGFKMPNGNTFTGFSIINNANGIVKFTRYSGDSTGVEFPMSGYRSHTDGSLYNVGSYGSVWLSSTDSQNYVYYLGFNSSYVIPQDGRYRAVGFSVRPVQDTGIEGQNKRTKIRIDQTITDPEAMITRIVDFGGIEAIRANSHRYAGYLVNEVMTLKQLDDNDSTKYVDGTTAVLTTVGIDVWMKLPQFHWKCSQYATDVWDFEVVYGTKPDDTYKTWDGDDLIGIYEAYVSDNLVYSVSNVSSTNNVSQTDFNTYAEARGNGFSIVKWKHHCMMAMLYYMWYGNTDCQSTVGRGMGNATKKTGLCNSYGMEDTIAENVNDINSINFWGLENWWGNKYEYIGNVSVSNKTFYIEEDDGTIRMAGPCVNGSNYIKRMEFGSNIDLIPTFVEGGATTGFCDYFYTSSSNNRSVIRSGRNASTDGGVAFINISNTDTYAGDTIGSRLCFRGNWVIL